MSLALTTQAVNRNLRTKQLYIQAQASGSYVPGGDTVNLKSITSPLALGQDTAIGFPGNITDYSVISAPPGFSASLIKGASLSSWAMQVFQNAAETPVGTPITLGPLSAAATNSTFTANGVATVLTTTPPPLNSFILLTNGASNKGIFLNGAIVQVTAVVPGVSYSFNFAAAKSLNYASATDTLKWQQLLGGSPNNPVALGTAAGMSIAVSSVAVASNTLTLVCSNVLAANPTGLAINPGNFIVLQGLVPGEVPQGAIVQVLTASTTGITANLIAPNLSATSLETGTATVLVTNGNAPIQATQDSFSINGTTVAASAASATAAGLVSVLPVNQTLTTGTIAVIQGLTHGAALNGLMSAVLAAGLTATNVELNGYIASAVTTGTADLGALGLLMTGLTVDAPTGELPAAAYPAAALAAPFVFMVEGPKLQM
jgi:hypothetical protein